MKQVILEEGTELKCPHCGKSEGYPVEDYTVPRSDAAHTNDCGWCDKLFTVQRLGNGKYEVNPIASTVGERGCAH